ncbi:hypothetical protein NUK34_12075 [Kerstersia gyiorum]|uniref:hypothetical protein n=1 Tax=Kerstersia gyiorum TaxID=206506 RepID=UPI00215007CE|nr:hypothetical protein [Kerstersia gyiorum]MCR4159592.1 hypothetical protein [Kerstersia gyiorum]
MAAKRQIIIIICIIQNSLFSKVFDFKGLSQHAGERPCIRQGKARLDRVLSTFAGLFRCGSSGAGLGKLAVFPVLEGLPHDPCFFTIK